MDVFVCGVCGDHSTEDELCSCIAPHIDELTARPAFLDSPEFLAVPDFSDIEFADLSGLLVPTNADLGFGPGDDDEQEAAQHFFSFGRILA